VRVAKNGILGAGPLLRETCERYGLPVAVTEVHLGCTREEQMRWLDEVWTSAKDLHQKGYELCAVTAWSLLGVYDWNSLVTRDEGFYEPGAFDLRGGTIRPTALANMLRGLGKTGEYTHPVLQTPGWWRRETRLLHEPVQPLQQIPSADEYSFADKGEVQPILLLGASTQVETTFKQLCHERALCLHVLSASDEELQTADFSQLIGTEIKPWAVLHAGALAVSTNDSGEEASWGKTCEKLAQWCVANDVQFAMLGSHHVFDDEASGAKKVESSTRLPISTIAQRQAEVEDLVLRQMPHALVIRSGLLFSPHQWNDWLAETVSNILQGREVVVTGEAPLTVSYLLDLVHATLDLLIDHATGVWHLSNEGTVTLQEFLRHAVRLAEANESLLRIERAKSDAVSTVTVSMTAGPFEDELLSCPAVNLCSTRGQIMPPWSKALHHFVDCAMQSRHVNRFKTATRPPFVEPQNEGTNNAPVLEAA
jgi:dTDP-4-dehydrorhamnose reductase